MKNKKFIKFLSIFMLAIMLVSTFSLPVFATAEGEVEEEAPSFWDQLFEIIGNIITVIFGAIAAVVVAIFILIVLVFFILFSLGESLFELIMLIITGITSLF